MCAEESLIRNKLAKDYLKRKEKRKKNEYLNKQPRPKYRQQETTKI
jgi:hypothetical protein